MDAIEFVKQLRRMDKSVIRKYSVFDDSPEDVVTEVEQWSKEHPIKTRQSVFLEQWPEANIDNFNVLEVCPASISTSHRNEYGGCANTGVECWDCRKEFWGQEVE